MALGGSLIVFERPLLQGITSCACAQWEKASQSFFGRHAAYFAMYPEHFCVTSVALSFLI